MISYNSKTLDNLDVIEAVEHALDKTCITKEEFEQIKTAYPVDLYTPHPYMRVGLFVLSLVVVFFSFGLFCLMFMGAGEMGIAGLTLFFGAGLYGAAEYMVHEKKHYKSGVDAALLWMSGGAVVVAVFIFTDTHVGLSAISLVFLAMSTLFVLRFADVSMSIVAYLSFLTFLFSVCMHAGRMVIPFMIMGVSLGTYLLARKLETIHTYRHYKSCLNMLQIVSLITLYLAGNYFVVREASNEMFDLNLQPGQSIPGASLFWILTVIVPPIYIFMGIRKKDYILIRTGLLLVGAIVYTIRTYHSVAPIEVAMTLGGIILIALAYGVTKLLQQPKNGFTSEQTEDDKTDALQLEAVIVAQTFDHIGPQANQIDFGGGSGSGGGTSGSY
jgi:hypothetical protein